MEAKQLIETYKPDIVFAADDNASKYLVVPYFKDSKIPFIFMGVNYTVKDYGYPFSNVTGIVEVEPIKPLIKETLKTLPKAKTAVFLAADQPTQKKVFKHIERATKKRGITLTPLYVQTLKAWQSAFLNAQQADFIYVSNKDGIKDWNKQKAAEFIKKNSKTLTITTYEWMAPYTMLSMTKIAKEQGEWASKMAIQILKGEKPSNIPIIPNSRWNLFINPTLLDKAGISLSKEIRHKAVTVTP